MHTTPSLPSLLRTTGLIKVKKGVLGVAALLLQYWSPPDVMVSIDSWEYPIDFLLLQPKTRFNGYPLIFEIPSLAIVDAYINSKVGNMSLKNRHLTKKIILYPPYQSLIEHHLPLWVEEEYDEFFYH